MNKIGIVAGSFDPITRGHTWLIKQAVELVDTLHVVIGINAGKKYMFTPAERAEQVETVLRSELCFDDYSKIYIDTLKNDLLIHFAEDIKAFHIFRGIRNVGDFEYESDIQEVNRRINHKIKHVYFIPPPDLGNVSSSTIKGLIGFYSWETVVSQFAHPSIVDCFRSKLDQVQKEK